MIVPRDPGPRGGSRRESNGRERLCVPFLHSTPKYVGQQRICLWVRHDEASQKLVVDARVEILFPIVTGGVPGEGEL